KYYESTATIDVDRAAPSGVIGQDAVAGRVASINDSEMFLTTQVSLIKSDSVLRPVVQKLHIPLSDVATRKDAPIGEAPVSLARLTVTRPPKTFLLQISYRSPNPQFSADVANAVAYSYIDHSYNTRFQATEKQASFMSRHLDELQAKM